MIERIEVNLLPAEYRVHFRRFSLKREYVYPLLFYFILFLILTSFTFSYDVKVNEYTTSINTLELQIKKNKHIPNEIKTLQKQETMIQNKIKALELIDVKQEKWIRLQEVFCMSLPKFTWIEKIEEQKGETTTIGIVGKTFSLSEVATYMSMLNESDYIFEIDLKKIEQASTERLIYSFELVCGIHPSIIVNEDVVVEKKS